MAKAAPALIGAGISAGTGSALAGSLGSAAAGGLMSKGSKAPPTPDPMAMAAAQTQSNLQTAQTQSTLNNINTYSPWGSTVYNQDPSTGQWNLQQSLSPEMQMLYNQQLGNMINLGSTANVFEGSSTNLPLSTAANMTQLGGNMAGLISPQLGQGAYMPLTSLTPQSFETNVTGGAGGQAIPQAVTSIAGAGQGLPSSTAGIQANVTGAGQGIQGQVGPTGPIQMSLSPQDFGAQIKQAQDATYQAQTQYLDPQFRQQEESMNQRLADQGIEEGSDAYTRAQGDFSRQKQMAYQSAQNSAVESGIQLQNQLFGQQLQSGQFANAAQAQQYVQQLQDAGFVNEAQAQNFNQQIAAGQFANQAAGQIFGQGLQAQGQGFQQQLAAGQFANQAQQQLFGQGLSLADLYNQAVLGAAQQGNAAAQIGLAQAQAQQQAPITGMNALLGAGQGLYGTGMSNAQQLAALQNIAPTWPLSIPQLGGTPTNVNPVNIANLQQAGTNAFTAAQAINNTNQRNMLGYGNLLSQGLTGQPLIGGTGGGLFGTGGLLGGIFNNTSTSIPFMGPWGAGSNLAGMGLGIPGIPD